MRNRFWYTQCENTVFCALHTWRCAIISFPEVVATKLEKQTKVKITSYFLLIQCKQNRAVVKKLDYFHGCIHQAPTKYDATTIIQIPPLQKNNIYTTSYKIHLDVSYLHYTARETTKWSIQPKPQTNQLIKNVTEVSKYKLVNTSY